MKHRLVNFYRYAILGVVFFMTTAIYSQTKGLTNPTQKQLDSLESYYNLSKADSLSIPERLENVTSYLEGILPSRKDSLIYDGLMQKTFLLGKAKQYDSAIVYSHQLYDLAREHQDTMYIVKALKKLRFYYKNNNQITNAFQYYNESYKIMRFVKDTIGAGRSLYYMADIQAMLGDHSGSKITAIDGVKYLEKTSDSVSLSALYHIISVANREQKNYSEALKYNEKAFKVGTDFSSIQIQKNTKANILADQGNHREAIVMLKILVSDSIVQQNKREYARVLDNLGYV